jgi:hypothetical protein
LRGNACAVSRTLCGQYAHAPTTKIEQNYLDIDANASAIITRHDG